MCSEKMPLGIDPETMAEAVLRRTAFLESSDEAMLRQGIVAAIRQAVAAARKEPRTIGPRAVRRVRYRHPPPHGTLQAIEHVSIANGGSRRSPRSEVSDEVVAATRKALTEERGRLWDSGWQVFLQPLATDGLYAYDLNYNGKPLVRCWLCTEASEQANKLWDIAKGKVSPGVRLRMPPVPWLAAALLPDAIPFSQENLGVLTEAGNLERCVAWALIEQGQQS